MGLMERGDPMDPEVSAIYRKRQEVVDQALGIQARAYKIQRHLKDLRQQKQWLMEDLQEIINSVDPVLRELLEHRDALLVNKKEA